MPADDPHISCLIGAGDHLSLSEQTLALNRSPRADPDANAVGGHAGRLGLARERSAESHQPVLALSVLCLRLSSSGVSLGSGAGVLGLDAPHHPNSCW